MTGNPLWDFIAFDQLLNQNGSSSGGNNNDDKLVKHYRTLELCFKVSGRQGLSSL